MTQKFNYPCITEEFENDLLNMVKKEFPELKIFHYYMPSELMPRSVYIRYENLDFCTIYGKDRLCIFADKLEFISQEELYLRWNPKMTYKCSTKKEISVSSAIEESHTIEEYRDKLKELIEVYQLLKMKEKEYKNQKQLEKIKEDFD